MSSSRTTEEVDTEVHRNKNEMGDGDGDRCRGLSGLTNLLWALGI